MADHEFADRIPPEVQEDIIEQWMDMAIRPIGILYMLKDKGYDMTDISRMDIVNWIKDEMIVRGAA